MADGHAPLDLTDRIHPCDWRFKGKSERADWFAENGEKIAQAHAQFVSAIQALGAVMKDTGAAERRDFTVADFTDGMIDDLQGYYAEEVRDWLGL